MGVLHVDAPEQGDSSVASRASSPADRIRPGRVSEETLISQSTLEGELKHGTGLLADLKRTMEFIADRSR
jgi:hypothetical protein